MSKITLSGVKLHPRIGVTPGERRQPQACDADIILWGDFEAAAATDSLEFAIDYSRVLDRVIETAHNREFNLLEALARVVARTLLSEFPVQKVSVRIRKRPATLSGRVDCIEIEMEEC